MAKKSLGKLTGEPVTYRIPIPAGGVQMETFIPWTLIKRGVKKEVITPLDAPEAFRAEAATARRERKASPLLRALGLAHYWQRLLEEGKFRSLTEIASAEEMDIGQVSRIARLAQLAPDIVGACVEGNGKVMLEGLIRGGLPTEWDEQRRKVNPATA